MDGHSLSSLQGKLGRLRVEESDGVEGLEAATACAGLPTMLQKLNECRRGLLSNQSPRDNEPEFREMITDLERKVIRQVEFYFGDHNLPKDRFMQQALEDNDGWLSMDTMVTFKRLADLSRDAEFIMKAVDKSRNKIVEVDFCAKRLRRHPMNPLPEISEARKLELQQRTVFVGGFPRFGITLDDLLHFFETGFAEVCNVRMRFRLQDRNRNILDEEAPPQERQFLGSLFVTFSTVLAAQDFIANSQELKYNNRKLFVKSQRDFFKEKLEDNDEFHPDKLARTVYVQGFDKIDTSDQEVAMFFAQFDDSETVRKRVQRDQSSYDATGGMWKFNGSVFVCFETEEAARQFVKVYTKTPLAYKGDLLKVKWQADFYEERGKFYRELQRWRNQREQSGEANS